MQLHRRAARTRDLPRFGINDQSVCFTARAEAVAANAIARARKIVHLENVMVMHLEIASGVEVPQHQHPHEQIGIILKGQIEVVIGNETRVIGSCEGYLS
jgi:quercetin dioxygenase-like cupin family protein